MPVIEIALFLLLQVSYVCFFLLAWQMFQRLSYFVQIPLIMFSSTCCVARVIQIYSALKQMDAYRHKEKSSRVKSGDSDGHGIGLPRSSHICTYKHNSEIRVQVHLIKAM
jgi:hypothetical protein